MLIAADPTTEHAASIRQARDGSIGDVQPKANALQVRAACTGVHRSIADTTGQALEATHQD